MILTFVKIILALGGGCLGIYFMVLAYTTELSGSMTNDIVLTLGLVMASGCATYLLIKAINKLIQ